MRSIQSAALLSGNLRGTKACGLDSRHFCEGIPAVKKPETAPNFLLFKGNMEAATPDCKAYYDLTSVVPAFY